MEIYIIATLILIISIIVFMILVKLLNVIPKKYHKSMELTSSFGIVLIISGTFITYYKDQNEKLEKEKSEYADNILEKFEKIDNFLIENYDDYSIILSIIYNKIQLPSSNEDINSILKKTDKKIKDILFIMYNKLTIIFEKMYLVNPLLFNNDRLGVRVRLYIENIFYYEYWNSSKQIYNTNFVKFMDDKYKFLTLSDAKYIKNDIEVYRIPYLSDVSFIFKSHKKNGLWY
jgi:hypothetical protein